MTEFTIHARNWRQARLMKSLMPDGELFVPYGAADAETMSPTADRAARRLMAEKRRAWRTGFMLGCWAAFILRIVLEALP